MLPKGCPNKYGNSVTNLRLSLLKIMSARVYFKKTVNGFKDVSLMSLQDEQ